MSMFSIKLKTKAGNDIKQKCTFTAIFRVNFKKNLISNKTTAEYTYRIYTAGIHADPLSVLEIKNSSEIMSIEDLILKVMLNLCHVIGKIAQEKNVTPDFVLFLSPDLDTKRSKAWQYCKDMFMREQNKDGKPSPFNAFTLTEGDPLDMWPDGTCKSFKIKRKELELLRAFVELNPNTNFIAFDPSRDKVKYAKSLKVCDMLQERIDRQITKEEVSTQPKS